jgi:hypothetical protein
VLTQSVPHQEPMSHDPRPDKDYFDSREQPVVDALAKEFTSIVQQGGSIRLVYSDPPVDVPKAIAARDAERLIAAAKMVPETAKELQRERLRDSVTAIALANVALMADADERGVAPLSFASLLPGQRDAIQRDCVVSLRLRRPVWRTVSRMKAQDALELGLQEHASHLLDKGQQKALAAFLTGPVWTAAVESLSGRVDVTPLEFAQAILRCGDE